MPVVMKTLGSFLAGKVGSNQSATFIVKTGRTMYAGSAVIIVLAWYSAARNERIDPKQKGKFTFWFPGIKKLKAKYPPDRPDSEDEGWQPAPSKGWGTSKGSAQPPSKTKLGSIPAGIPHTEQEAKALAGVAAYDGHLVARWIIPFLNYAKLRGWKGSVSSGFRSYQEQYRIYYIEGIRPAAVPGTSNHEGKVFPKGAVDVTEYEELNRILQGIPGSLLEWAGAADEVHFSHQHNGSY
jgi:hypothetical protein